MGNWKYGLFSVERPVTCVATYFCPCVQFGMTERALNHNFLGGCLFSLCCPIVSTLVQRQAVAKHAGIPSNCIVDLALSCVCCCCVTVQCANEMGDAADITKFKVEYLTKPPTAQEMEAQVHDAAHNASSAKTDNPLAK